MKSLLAAVFAAALAPNGIPEALDAFLDARFDATPETTRALAERCRKAGLGAAEVEKLLRAGRASYPAKPVAAPGRLTKSIPLACDHVDYETVFHLYVPKGYSPRAKKAWPLVLVGHGGNAAMSPERAAATAESYIEPWIDEAEERGFLVAAPATARGWSWIGSSILASLVSKLGREYRVDPDRVYATGHSMGGHMAWRCGIFEGDRYGAIGPMSGGYDYVENGQVLALFNVPGYATHGRDEPYGIADHNRKIREWMAERKWSFWSIVEKPGGHEIFEDEIPRMAEFFLGHPRDLYREKVSVRAEGKLRLDAAEPRNPGWPVDHAWRRGRAIPQETFHWVRVFGGAPGVQRALVTRRKGSNAIDVVASGVPRLRLYLHSRMFDLSRDIAITVNGEKRSIRAERRLETMLDLAREFDDRGRVFEAAIDLDVGTSRDVPEPRK